MTYRIKLQYLASPTAGWKAETFDCDGPPRSNDFGWYIADKDGTNIFVPYSSLITLSWRKVND